MERNEQNSWNFRSIAANFPSEQNIELQSDNFLQQGGSHRSESSSPVSEQQDELEIDNEEY